MYRSIRHVEFPKFQTGILAEWKATAVFLFKRVAVSGDLKNFFFVSKKLDLHVIRLPTLQYTYKRLINLLTKTQHTKITSSFLLVLSQYNHDVSISRY